MNMEENDPDTLQMLDELDTDWVKRWHDLICKETKAADALKFLVLPPEKLTEEESLRADSSQ